MTVRTSAYVCVVDVHLEKRIDLPVGPESDWTSKTASPRYLSLWSELLASSAFCRTPAPNTLSIRQRRHCISVDWRHVGRHTGNNLYDARYGADGRHDFRGRVIGRDGSTSPGVVVCLVVRHEPSASATNVINKLTKWIASRSSAAESAPHWLALNMRVVGAPVMDC